MKKIAWRIWNKNKPWERWYVAQVKGEDGADYGYVVLESQAKPLSVYWQRRFAADCRRVGDKAHFEPVPRYEVIVGNVGMVYDGDEKDVARTKYSEYIDASKSNRGRVAGEPVTLMRDGEIEMEYMPDEVPE